MITSYKKNLVKKRKIHSVKVRLSPGSAKPGPPLSGLLAPYGIDILRFCSEFNKLSLDLKIDKDLDLDIVIYIDVIKKNFSFIIKGLSISYLLEILYGDEEYINVSFLDVYKIFLIKEYFMKKNLMNFNHISLLKSIVHTINNYQKNKF